MLNAPRSITTDARLSADGLWPHVARYVCSHRFISGYSQLFAEFDHFPNRRVWRETHPSTHTQCMCGLDIVMDANNSTYYTSENFSINSAWVAVSRWNTLHLDDWYAVGEEGWGWRMLSGDCARGRVPNLMLDCSNCAKCIGVFISRSAVCVCRSGIRNKNDITNSAWVAY